MPEGLGEAVPMEMSRNLLLQQHLASISLPAVVGAKQTQARRVQIQSINFCVL